MNFQQLTFLFVISLFSLDSIAGSSIVFTTLGRSRYTFDIFAVPITVTDGLSVGHQNELRLSDGVSVNYNGFFPSNSSTAVIYISERNGSSNVYLQSSTRDTPYSLLPFSASPSMKDRPSISSENLVYVSTHQPFPSPRRSWVAVYSTHLPSGLTRRLTPVDASDFSPSVSPSGEWTAVASSRWVGDVVQDRNASIHAFLEVQDLNTSIYAFRTLDGSDRTLIIDHGGWPCWADDNTLYFHRRCSDGWWSVYRAGIDASGVVTINRITPRGFHAFTPAATVGAPWLVAVATRRPTSGFRHIELIDIRTNAYVEVTRSFSPNAHHYNPFVSPDATRIGYHRCRGSRDGDPPMVWENIWSSSSEALSLFRIDGSFPSFSPNFDRIAFVRSPHFDRLASARSGLYVVNSDGSGEPREVFTGNAFATAWDWKRKGVIYTSYGRDFARESTRVDIIAITLNDDDENSEPSIKKLTVNGENNAFPSPSPDGKWVVFRSGRPGHMNLYIMDAVDGESASIHRLTDGPWTDTMCNWSPDGEWIAFASNRDEPSSLSFAIYIVHPNGTRLTRVVHSGNGGMANHPWFSPDSKSLVYTSDYAAVSAEPIANPHHFQPYGEIFTVNIDGSKIQRLTHNSFEDGTPTWTPFSMKPASVTETLNENALCTFDDVHWLKLQGQNNNVFCATSR